MCAAHGFGSIDRRRGHGAIVLLLTGLCLAVAVPADVVAQEMPSGRRAGRDDFAAHVAEAAQRFGIPAAWIRAVMRAESADDPHAVSNKGAIGLMQIMPATWAALRARHRLGHNPYDSRDNILAGAAYLRELHDRYGAPGFLAAYNAGPGRYEEHLTTGRALPAETRAYVAAIAPMIGGGGTASPVLVAVVDPLAWTRAPLFVVQPDRRSTADPAANGGRSGNATIASERRDVSTVVPQSTGLFVARSDARTPR